MMALALLALCGFMAVAPAAAELAPVPPAPADGLYDDSSVFDATQRATAVRAVAQARAAGINLHVAIYRFMLGETIEQRAERLKAAWCPDQDGLLVVADTSTNQCTYLSDGSDTEWLSTTELHRIFTEASTIAAATEGTTSDKILVVIENLAPRLRAAMAQHRALTRHQISPGVWWIVSGMAATSLFFLLIASSVRWIIKRSRQSASPAPSYFPAVQVAERFGAPFGGGVIAEITYQPIKNQRN